MRIVLLTALALLITVPALAQTTAPYTTADKVLWDASPDAVNLADAQAATYKAYTQGSGVQPANAQLVHTCVAPVAPDVKASCSANLTTALLPALNARVGQITVSAAVAIIQQDGSTQLTEGPQSAPFGVGRPYGAPGRTRLNR